MAVHFDQTYIGGHTCIYKGAAVVTQLPMSFVAEVNVQQFNITKTIVQICRNLGNPGNGFALKLSGGTSSCRIVAQVGSFVYIQESVTTSTLNFDTWAWIGAVFNGTGTLPTSLIAYLNGVAATENTNPLLLDASGIRRTRICGGPSDSSTFGFQGCARNVGIYNVALSGANMASIAGGAALNTVQGSNLVTWFKMLTGETADVDEMGSGWSIAEFGGGMTTCGGDIVGTPAGSQTRVIGF